MKKKILVVDDEEDFQDIIRQVLEPAGYHVDGAGDGAACLAALRQHGPDLVILDVNMPIKDGYAVCREIRADPKFCDVPVLMLTIRNRDKEIMQGLDCGADDYLTKPFRSQELLARIHNLLKRA